ncbi:MAG: thiamine-phosphate kinase [Methanobacteriota archaeon]
MKTLADIGERNAIQQISHIITQGNSAVGIGDDCAAIQLGDEYLLITTDMITQKTHIPKEMTPYQIGWFIVAINLSDLAAKGGKPLGVVLSLGLPPSTKEQFLKELMRGADACATRFHTSIIGGDTKENPALTLCGTAVGIIKKNEFMPRKGMRPGDIVAVTGMLGKAGAGYLALQQQNRNKNVLKGLFEPVPRIREGRALAQEKIVSSCMDISDGLSSSLYQLQQLNPVGFEIQQEQLPVSSELTKLRNLEQKEIDKYVLHFGGDYELLCTLSPKNFERAVQAMKKTGTPITAIGRVTKEKKIYLVSPQGKRKILPDKGYEHFSSHTFS